MSKEKNDKKIGDVLQGKQSTLLSVEKTCKTLFHSSPIRINVPINPPLETIGALCELITEEVSFKEPTESDDEGDYADQVPDGFPLQLEDFILFEHNYAVGLLHFSSKYTKKDQEPLNQNKTDIFYSKDSIKIENDVPALLENNQQTSESSETSKHYIEKLEHDIIDEQTLSATEDNQLVEESMENFTKETNVKEDEQKYSFSEESLSNSNIDNKSLNFCSNYKNFAEFKKRHLKVVIEDCKNKEDILFGAFSDAIKNGAKDSSIHKEQKDEKPKEFLPSDIIDTTVKMENLCKSRVSSFQKLKCGKNVFKSNVRTNKSLDLNKEKLLKGSKRSLALTTKLGNSSETNEKDENSPSSRSKKVKHSSLSSDGNLFFDDTTECANTTKIGRRKKCVSFSDELVSSIKYEEVDKKKTFDNIEIANQKSEAFVNSSTPPCSKSQKKKVARRESVRSVLNENEPPLFSQPDVMVKVNDDITFKRDDKESENILYVPHEGVLEEDTTEKENNKFDISRESIANEKKELHLKFCAANIELDESEDIEAKNVKVKCIVEDNEQNKMVSKKDEIINSTNKDDLISNKNLAFELSASSKIENKLCFKKEDNQKINSANKSNLKNHKSDDNSVSEPFEKNTSGKDIKLSPFAKQQKEISSFNDNLMARNTAIDTNNVDEKKQKPGRKSSRLIKKKEFFGDASDSDSKKTSASQNKRIIGGSDSESKKAKHRGRSTKTEGRLSENKGFELDVVEDSSETEDDPEKLWCICRKPHNSRFMIQCDKCEDWFHGSCIGVTKQQGKQLEKQKKEWNCPNCSVEYEDCLGNQEKTKHSSDFGSTVAKNSKALEEKCSKLRDTHLHNSKRKSESSPNVPASANARKDKSLQQVRKSLYSASKEEMENKISKKLSKTTEMLNTDLKSKYSKLMHEKKSSGVQKLDIHHKTPALQKQSSALTKNATSPKKAEIVQHSNAKPATVSVTKKKIINPIKDKTNTTRKKQNCVQCQLEAQTNSCYCTDVCIEKHATQCLKVLRDSKGTLKDSEFESQRLVVFDRSKGNVMVNGPTACQIVTWLKANPSFTIACSANTSTKKVSTSQKKECDSNSASEKKDATDETAKATVRLNVRKTLKNILIDRCKNADDIKMNEEDIQKIADKIEEELYSFLKDIGFKYRAKYRSLMFNIKDPRNQGLFRKIVRGSITPNHLVHMSSEELASMELARWREQENQHLLDMIKRGQLEQQKSGSSLLLKKTHKGEVEIEDDLTSIIEQDDSKTLPKGIPEKSVEPEKEIEKDTTHLHRSHLFSLNCKICTGKVLPPPVEEVILKKVRVAHSISVDLHSPNTSDSVEKNVSRIVGVKSPASSTEDDSMDQEPTSTVSIESPESILKSSVIDVPSKTATSVWKGFIFMQDVAKFLTSAYKVSGQTDQLQAILPDTIQVCGRIVPDQVWDYLGKIKQSGSKELIIIRFQAANEEEALTYHSFYSYLSSRKRYGVVSHITKKIKDFYILPLASTSPVPMVLVPFDGPGLPSPRPHLLLGVIVRHKFKQTAITILPKQPSLSKTEVETSGPISGSFTPPQESRSYTPPLPAMTLLDKTQKSDSVYVHSPDSLNLEDKQAIPLNNSKNLSDNSMYEGSYTRSDKVFLKDEDKPYDPEQDCLIIISEKSEKKSNSSVVNERTVSGSDNLEQHKKILDALTREVEETDRQVNALKQLISQPEDEASLQSSSTASIDINSVAETGMSSFFDLPENLQDILNAVHSKSHDSKTHDKEDVDMRISTLFGKHSIDAKENKVSLPIFKNSDILDTSRKVFYDSEMAYSPQAPTPPPNDDESNTTLVACPSDPRIKLRTSFREQSFVANESSSTSEQVAYIQKQFLEEKMDHISNKLSASCWNSSKEPPPPGIEPPEYHINQNIISAKTVSDTEAPLAYVSLNLEQNSPQQDSSVCSQSFSSLPSCFPPGFSLLTPPPNIKHYPPLPPMIQTPFPPPPLPIQVLSPKESESIPVEATWPTSSTTPEDNNWQGGLHWNETEHQGDVRHYSAERSANYHSQHFHKRDSKNRHPERLCGYTRGRWNKYSKQNRYENLRKCNNGFKRHQ